MLTLYSISIPRSTQQYSRPPTRIIPRIGVGCQSFTLPSSANYECYEGCNGFTLRRTFSLYYGSRRSQTASAWAWS
jgi:hypothetical protein